MTLGIRVSPWLWTPPNVMKKYEKHDWTIGNSAFVMGSLGIFFGTPQRSTILARWTGGVSPQALNHRPDKNAIGSSIGTWNGRWNQHDSEHLHGFFQHFLPLMFRCVFFLGHVPYTARHPKRHDFAKLLKVAARSTTGNLKGKMMLLTVSGSP